MKNNKNLIMSSFFMFAISLVCLMTASYAWFSMAGSVEVHSPEFSASAPENLQISSDGENWASSISVNLGNANELKINPASSYTGIDGKIFYTEKVNDGVSDDNTEFEVAQKGVSSNQEGYYLDVPLWIRTTGDKEVKIALDVEDIQNTFAKDLDKDGNVTENKKIAKAVRIGFINPNKDKNALNTDIPLVYNANGDFNGKVISSLNENKTAIKETPVYLSNSTQMLLVPAYSQTNQKGTPFIARIWIEGEDPNCVFANGGKSFAISLKFIAID
ncbi:hypothetical protein [Eubacterium sp.]